MWEGYRKTVGGSDGGSDHGIAGTYQIQLLAPVVRGRKGRHEKVLDQAKRSGYVRVQIDGDMYELSEEIKLDKNIKHTIAVVVDRLAVKPGIEKRLTDSVESVLALADGLLVVDTMDGNYLNFSQSFSCPDCGISIDEIEPRSFSFNNPFGACPDCLGLGYKMEFDERLMIRIRRCPSRKVRLQYSAGSPVQQREALPERFWMRCVKNIILICPRRFRIIRRRSTIF